MESFSAGPGGKGAGFHCLAAHIASFVGRLTHCKATQAAACPRFALSGHLPTGVCQMMPLYTKKGATYNPCGLSPLPYSFVSHQMPGGEIGPCSRSSTWHVSREPCVPLSETHDSRPVLGKVNLHDSQPPPQHDRLAPDLCSIVIPPFKKIVSPCQCAFC